MRILNHLSKSFLFAITPFLLTGCGGLIQKMAVGTTSGVMYAATGEIETEKNWEMFRTGAPANLKMMEGLLSLDPDNQDLLAGLAKGYTGYAYAVDETLAFEDQLVGRTPSVNKALAIANYTKGLAYGLRYLKEEGITLEDLRGRLTEDNGIAAVLDEKLGTDTRDLETLMFTGHALGAMINLQRNDLVLVAQLPIAKAFFDWVCARRPEINFGACGVFEGAYEAGRPKMLGGNPEKGKKIFLETIKKYPDNALLRASYVQYYLLPQGDQDGYKEQARELEKAELALRKASNWSPTAPSVEAADKGGERLWLFRAIGLKRYEILKKHEKKLF